MSGQAAWYNISSIFGMELSDSHIKGAQEWSLDWLPAGLHIVFNGVLTAGSDTAICVAHPFFCRTPWGALVLSLSSADGKERQGCFLDPWGMHLDLI